MSASRALILLSIAACGVAGCHKPPAVVPPPAPPATVAARPQAGPPPRQTPAPAPAPAASPTAMSEDEAFRRESLDQLNREQPLGDAFFDYDAATLREDTRKILATDATWLRKWSQTDIRIEGHCDERGTSEYNIALGQQRAEAVGKYLASLGIEPGRMTMTSVGKESPFCTTSKSESCWSQNRRDHFVITAK
jgi:peptidoglycan-associated lipoprotein